MENIDFYFDEYSMEEMEKRSEEFYLEMKKRRSVRQFSDQPVPRKVIENCIRAAGTAPSGANMQPWTFVVVGDPKLKSRFVKKLKRQRGNFIITKPTQIG